VLKITMQINTTQTDWVFEHNTRISNIADVTCIYSRKGTLIQK